MGFVCPMEEKFSFVYRAEFSNGLTEYEFDHVFIGRYNDIPNINPDEAMDYKRVSIQELLEEIEKNPESITPWTRIIMQDYLSALVD